MNFEELQIIWNRQQDEPLFVIKQDFVHAFILRKTSSIRRCIAWFEWTIICVPLLLALILPIDAWRESGGWDQYLVALICLFFGASALMRRLKRQKETQRFDQSIKGIVEASIARIDDHVRRLRLAFWAFNLPIAISAAIGLTIYSNARTPLIWGGVMFVTVISYWGTRRDCRKKQKEKHELEVLLQKLAEAETPPV